MTKEQAEKRIQELLAEVKSLADEHKVEFSFAGATMHYRNSWMDDGVYAKNGLLCSDEEWNSSNCYGAVTNWEMKEFD